MLIPSARKNLSTLLIRNTMLPPYETAKTIILNETDFDLILRDADGNLSSLSHYNDKPILINFWATWCPPCIAEMPSLQRLYNKYKDDVHFIFIVNEPFDLIYNYLQQKNYNIPCFTTIGDVPEVFDPAIIPTTYLIDNEFVLLYNTGAARWDSGKVMRIIDELIEKNNNR